MRILRLVPDLPRLRISSIDSIEVDDNLMQAIATEPRLMPHLHLSLQHGDDLILKRMKRRHLRDDAIRFAEEARKLRPDMTFGADIIAGFPTETEAHVRKLAEAGGRLRPDMAACLPLFPAPRHACRADATGGRARDQGPRRPPARCRCQRECNNTCQRRSGATHHILMEHPRMGRTEQFTEVCFDTDQPESQIVTATVTGISGTQLTA